MRVVIGILILSLLACNSKKEEKATAFIQGVRVETILKDSISIRAIEVMGNNLAFAGNNGKYGLYNSATKSFKINTQQYDTLFPEFRAVANTANDFFMLNVGSPALLYKTGNNGKMELVYKEDGNKVFYDAMAFWNDQEGIAMGDPVENCLSIIITRDGGNSWEKLDCSTLPDSGEEGAFAASNTNIAIQGDDTWILTGGMKTQVLFSPDKGKTWKKYDTPLVNGKQTTGGYSIDFYDKNNGIIMGGDYTSPDDNLANKAVTTDGGKTWQLVAQGQEPAYKSCVRYVPNGNAREIVAVGFTGIDYSKDGGKNWKKLAADGFYTIRFLNDSTAYAAGKNRIAKLKFLRN